MSVGTVQPSVFTSSQNPPPPSANQQASSTQGALVDATSSSANNGNGAANVGSGSTAAPVQAQPVQSSLLGTADLVLGDGGGALAYWETAQIAAMYFV